ncbi:Glutamyl tRNA synthetase cytoplasmic [Fasciola gigantica]|uniref:Glutamyl tRNA synthetase cytoplasmic n=1 Tax=Fasciola gigantica TaxID=46835 RepID=A0A504YCY3_FASGI|nr:Glutamyl tRNA synthetase cytoplasmic [Fasciola gigantica]
MMESAIEWIYNNLKKNSVDIPSEALLSIIPKTNGTPSIHVLNWVRFVPAYLMNSKKRSWAMEQLEKSLTHATFLVGDDFSVADLAVLCFLECDEEFQKLVVSEEWNSPNFCHVRRYYNHLSSMEQLKELKAKLSERPKLAVKSAEALEGTCGDNAEADISGKTVAADMRFEMGGKFGELPGAKVGEVVVRFPPEASGYLHIGHAKAALLNQHYRDTFKGRLILRFDDTNPSKEKANFEESILCDLPRIGVKWDVRSHTSDHFDLLINLCEKMLREGKAYVDNTDTETMRTERENRKPSACRENTTQQNLAWWEEMKKGTEFGLKCCVRAKIDMNSNNGAMRDPTIYRCKPESHVRTGTKYNVYPIYDFACPVVDSIEGVTHALRTSEYNDRNDQYAWFCQVLGLRCPMVIDYSRLALQNTILSKRKLTWFVEEGLVDGWDDPRMPTVSGILRRGMTAEGLRQFILAQGSSRSSAQMEWDKIWAFNKKVIDPIAPRFTGLLLDPSVPQPSPNTPIGLVPVRIHGQSEIQEKLVAVHPKNESLGHRKIMVSPLVYVEHADATCFKEGENVTFINWGNCRIVKIHRSEAYITAVDGELNLQDTDYKKTLKITWLPELEDKSPALCPVTCLIYDHLLTKGILGKDEDFKPYVNRNSKVEQCLLGDPDVRNLKKGEIIQLQRRGYYIVDVPYEAKCKATGFESPCVLIQIPEGTMSKTTTDTAGSTASQAKKGGSVKASAKQPKAEMTEEEAAKALERQRKKEEKKEARKEGRAKAKQAKETTECSETQSTSIKTQPEPASSNEQPQNRKQEQCVKPTVEAVSRPPIVAESCSAKSIKIPKSDQVELSKKEGAKKQTRLALEATKESEFSEWYSQLITKAELLEYYDISGCYIIRPWAYSLWQTIQRFLDERLHAMGVENAYFPMFVSKGALEREKNHVSDFAPEVAWVTKSGDSDLAEPVAVRPTSETIMYPAFAKWIQSHRDLPLRLNQWSNVVRWEFKHPQPFLRTREFLWQEGHTAYAEKPDAEAEVLAILDLYAQVYQDLLAVPVIKGRKTEREKFAGADYTTTIEAYISGTGRAIQGATSHHLGQNFSRMFEVTYDHPVTGKPAFVYQNSWGLTTRTLGVLVMVHGDSKGLVLPPRIAPHQIVVVPCGITNKSSQEDRENLLSYALLVTKTLKEDSSQFRVHCDDRTHVSPGWKFNHWEMKGVPVRLEVGPQEMAKQSTCLVLRHNGIKLTVPLADICARMPQILEDIHNDLLRKATGELAAHVVQVVSLDQLCSALDAKSLALAPFCGDSDCEEIIRRESARNVVVEPGAPSMGAKSLCIPFSCPFNDKLVCGSPAAGTKCFNQPHCSRVATAYTLFGRSY